MKNYTITIELNDGRNNSVNTDDFECALGIFNRAKEAAKCRGWNAIVSVFGTYGELIETATVNPSAVYTM